MNVKIKTQIQHLSFTEEHFLQKILTIAERCLSRKVSQLGMCRIHVEEIQELFSITHFFAEIVVKFEVKPDEDIKALTLKAIVNMYYLEEIITKTSEA